MQAGTLSHLLAEQATKEDLRVLSAELRGEMRTLRAEMGELRAELRGEMGELRAELRGEMGELRAELRGEMQTLSERLERRFAETDARIASMQSRLTWGLIAAAAFLGTVMTLVGAFMN